MPKTRTTSTSAASGATSAAVGAPTAAESTTSTTQDPQTVPAAAQPHPDGPWTRVRNSVGEFDLHETQVAAGLPGGVEEVPEYPRAHIARPAKPYTDLAGNPAARRTAGEPGGRE